MKRLRISIFISIVNILITIPLFSQQDILTAEAFFDRVSEHYGSIEDYRASIEFTIENEIMKGTLYYKRPNLLRIDFTEPEDQVIVTNGEEMQVYIPQYRVIMTQTLRKRSEASVASMASEQGLHLLKRNYSISYLTGPIPVPINAYPEEDPLLEATKTEDRSGENENQEMVVKLRLRWRTSDEGFRQLTISVGEDNLISRIDGITVGYQKVRFDFKDIETNIGLPVGRFNYESPPTANIFDNFLFDPKN